MKFDIYFAFQNKEGKWCPGIKAQPRSWDEIKILMQDPRWQQIVKDVRDGKKERKMELPAVDWVGRTTSGRRLAADCVPTQLFMVDVDHVKDIEACVNEVKGAILADVELKDNVLCMHITPNRGLRIVCRAVVDEPRLIDHMNWLNEKLNLSQYGDFDTAVKDFSRISFLVPLNEFAYWNDALFNADELEGPLNSEVSQKEEEEPSAQEQKKPKAEEGRLFDNTSVSEFTEDEKKKFDTFEYRGTPIKLIIEKYVEQTGEPGSGEIHNYYNELVKNFRNICDNNKRLLLYILPRFGHTIDECWSQIKSITKANTLSRLDKPFYFFLKDNGFYTPRGKKEDSLKEFMMNETEEVVDMPPYLPPVFKELVSIAPKDFVIPAVNSLLPILGTLTSYLQAIYPYDNREHTTSFFSVIYAPPGTGKGFVERYLDLLFEDLKLRDLVQSERENVYLRVIQRKGANDKAPEMPHTSLRLIPAKNSEAEFLQKQRDNHGYHMFTYAAEMDSWAKGVRAAGGNKDDMIRIAWDNGEYGQQFKSANTFKGVVRLYWNVLITGTIAQLESYFKNVENGLVTRCSFSSIDNQEFAAAPVWKPINKKSMERIKKFMERCDRRTYEQPCTIDVSELLEVSDDEFDKEIDWRFKFKERQEVDMSWIMPTIEKFHKEQTQKAALDVDRARDVFRRRVGVRGFRLGLICYGLWETPRPSDLAKCCTFIYWWMHKDIESMLKLWGSRYNEQTDTSPISVQRSVFDKLDETFTKNDVYVVCLKQGIKTPVRRILFEWKKQGYVVQQDKEHFKKKS